MNRNLGTFHWKLIWAFLLFAQICFGETKNLPQKIEYEDVINHPVSAIGCGFDRKLHNRLGFLHPNIVVASVKLDYRSDIKAFVVAKDQLYEGEIAEWDLETSGEFPNFKYSAKIRYPSRQADLKKQQKKEARKPGLSP